MLVAALLLTGCSAGQNNNSEDTSPIDYSATATESVWASLPDEEGFEETLQNTLSEMSNTDIKIEDYKCENGQISCNCLDGQVNFMGNVINGKVTTSFVLTSLESFNQYKDSSELFFLGLVIAPLALYNHDCTDRESLVSFVDLIAESGDVEGDSTILEKDGIEYTYSSKYLLSCQARYVEDMSIYDVDNTSEQLESTLPDQDSNDTQNDQSADAPDNESVSSNGNWTYKGSSGVIYPRFYDEFGTEIGNYYSIDIPTFWDGKYDIEVIPNGYGYNASFYCSSERETGCGGLLFSVLMLDLEDDYTIYPSYDFMGKMGVYRIGTYNMVIYYPSDVQWQNPESGYSAMATSIDDIVASIKFGDEVTFIKANSN